jgi:hypothetical protein
MQYAPPVASEMIVMSFGQAQESAVHVPLRQSPATLQRFPTVHLPHAVPPQSTSVSSPSVFLSLHIAHWPFAHWAPVTQSSVTWHFLPTGQRAQPPVPPQSTSLSVPSIFPVLQVPESTVPPPSPVLPSIRMLASTGIALASGSPPGLGCGSLLLHATKNPTTTEVDKNKDHLVE